ncbi:unnamed protein product [Lota lota]
MRATQGLCFGPSIVVIVIRDDMLLAEAPLASHVTGRVAGVLAQQLQPPVGSARAPAAAEILSTERDSGS